MPKWGQQIVGALLAALLFTGAGAAWASRAEGGIPLGATPVDVAVMSDGRIVVLMEALTDPARDALAGTNVPSDAASVSVFRVQGDGHVWLRSETILHQEQAVRTEKQAPERGFQVDALPFTAIDPSHMVVSGYASGEEDRVFVLSHRFERIFVLSGFDLDQVDILGGVQVEGDPFMAFADLDTDGTNDLTLVTPADRRVRVYKGEGGGTFGGEEDDLLANYELGARGDEPRAVDVFNLSKFPDYPPLGIVVAHGGILSDAISILVSRGDGVIHLGPSMSATATPRSAVAADFTNDGIPDLVVVGANNFVFLKGLERAPDWEGGAPRFGPKQPGQPVNIPGDYEGRVGIVAADFNLDGKMDLAIANMGDGTVDVWLGNGDGTFRTGQRISMGAGARPVALAVDDINGNGILDLVVANQGTDELVVRMGRGNGTFDIRPDVADAVQFAGRQFGVGDLDGEGGANLVRALTVGPHDGPDVIKHGEQKEEKEAVGSDEKMFLIRTWEHELKITDRVLHCLNQLGVEKLPGTRRGILFEMWPALDLDTASAWLQHIQDERDDDAADGFVPRALLRDHYPTAMAIGDVLGDGLDEIVSVDSLGRDLRVLKWFEVVVRGSAAADTLYDYRVTFPWKHPLPTAIVLADLDPDSDGKEIVVLNARSGSALVMRADIGYDQTEQDQLTTTVVGYGWIGKDPVAGVALPAENGGDDMLVVADYTSNALHILTRNDAEAGEPQVRILDSSQPVQLPGTQGGPINVVAGEFGDEGYQHVAVAHDGVNRIIIFARVGQTLREVEILELEARPINVAVGDFDGDGLQDIAVVSADGLEILWGNADVTFDKCFVRTPEQLGGLPLWVGAGDFNEDGHTDIVVPVGRFDDYGLAVHGVSYDDVWAEFGPLERECE